MEEEIIECLEGNRINIEVECAYCDPTGALRREYERANEMLDDCIISVRNYFKSRS